MSVRKEYQLIVNGVVVLVGSKAMVEVAYRAMNNHFHALLPHTDPSVLEYVYGSIVIAYKPN